MKTEINATIVVAAIAATASVFGVLYNQYSTLKLERQKWEQNIESERLKLEREAVTDFAKTMANAFYLSEDMIWRVEMMAPSLTRKDFLAYAASSEQLKLKLVTAEVMLAATSAARHEKVKAALSEYRRVDEQLIVTGRNIDKDRGRSLEVLESEVKALPKYRDLVFDSLLNAAAIKVAAR